MSNQVIHEALDAYVEAARRHREASERHEQKRQEFQAADADRASARKEMFCTRSKLDSLLEEQGQ